ncbi:helix-turn-helix domain-containing protein [Ornithinimicrobium humiphilum]
MGQLDLPAPLDLVASHYWWVRWRREESRPFRPQVLGHPVVHLTVEDAEGGTMHGHGMPSALVHGLVTRVFAVDLPPAGRVAGVAFHPGGLAALLGASVLALTDRVVRAEEVLGPDVAEVTRVVLAEPDETARRDALVADLTRRLEPVLERVAEDAAYTTVRAAVELMRAREHRTLAPVAEALHVSPRTLQRMFARYVGASPLWVLRRYRLQDAATAIDAGEADDLAALAADLGFADQAHLTRAFTTVIGVPPSAYRDRATG